MYTTLITKINATLDKVTRVKDHFTSPKSNLTEFPAVFYKPSGLENTFETQNENYKVYRFIMIVMIGTGGTTIEEAFGTVLPKVVDDIIAQFDQDWSSTINGHRVSTKIDSADAWEVSEEQEGKIAYAPLSLEIRLLTDN